MDPKVGPVPQVKLLCVLYVPSKRHPALGQITPSVGKYTLSQLRYSIFGCEKYLLLG